MAKGVERVKSQEQGVDSRISQSLESLERIKE